jgi:hypothetical protein
MKRGQGRTNYNQRSDRFASNPKEQVIFSEFQTELTQSESANRDPTEVFALFIAKYVSNNISIRNLIKIGLSDRHKSKIEHSQKPASTREIINLVFDDIVRERNQNSNPSMFFKFIGINNLNSLNGADVDYALMVCLKKLNFFISCDKNIFYLLLKLLKIHASTISEEQKTAVLNRLLESFLLYFSEFENKRLRKDQEVIKNFISHFKIFNFLVELRYFDKFEISLQSSLLKMTICTLFIETPLEDKVFNSSKRLILDIAEKVQLRVGRIAIDHFPNNLQQSRIIRS